MKNIIISALSTAVFSFILNKYNEKVYPVFMPIQKDLQKLKSSTRACLQLQGFLLSIFIIIYLSSPAFDINETLLMMLLGLFISIGSVCFAKKTNNNIM